MSEQVTFTVEARVLGQRRPLAERWTVALERADAEGSVTLREALVAIVTDEVNAFNQRQRERRLIRVMTREEIERGAEAGKVDMVGLDARAPQQAQVTDAIATALQAFADRFYLVLLDGMSIETLDTPLTLHADSHLTFVRLVPLIGG